MKKIARKFVLIYFKKEKKKKVSKIMLLPVNKPDLIEMEIYIITYDI